MVKIKNSLTTTMNVVKVNIYDLGTLNPGEEIDVSIEEETTLIDLRESI